MVFDSLGLFRKENNLPDVSELHTFLINVENKIVAVGNPTTNPRILQLYKDFIISTHPRVNNPPVTLSPTFLSFGAITTPLSKTIKTYIGNNSDKDTLVISDVIPSCDCMKVKLSADTILPNKTVVCSITFDGFHVTDEVIHPYCEIFIDNYENPVVFKMVGYQKTLYGINNHNTH